MTNKPTARPPLTTPKPQPGFDPVYRADKSQIYIIGLDASGVVKVKIYGRDVRAAGKPPSDFRATAASAHRLAAACIDRGLWVHTTNETWEVDGRNVALVFWEPTAAELEDGTIETVVETMKESIRSLI